MTDVDDDAAYDAASVVVVVTLSYGPYCVRDSYPGWAP